MKPRSRDQETHLYRRVSVRMWADAKFRALSKPQPNGQTLWLHLIAGEQTDIIPGLFRIGEAAFAEQLGWPLEAFRDAFAEAISQGMARADWEARLVWVPKAIFYNPPQSINVVKSWRHAWQRLPECGLKDEAYQYLNAFLYGLGDAFAYAFADAISHPGAGTGTGTGVKNTPPGPDLFPRREQAEKQRLDADCTFDEFRDLCRSIGEKGLPETDAAFAYAKKINLPVEFLKLCWLEFAARSMAKEPPTRQKGVKGWRQAFGNCVRGNWYHLWFKNETEWALTTAGQQAKQAHAERRAAPAEAQQHGAAA